MALHNYIEKTGVIVPDTGELLQDVMAEFRSIYGADMVIEPESHLGRLINAETESRDAVVRNNAKMANQINPNLAGGVFLDAIAALTGLQRKGATSTYVPAVLGGVPGALVPAGQEIHTVDGHVFYTEKAVILAVNGKGYTTCKSKEKRAVPCPVGALSKLKNPRLGLETVTNEEPACQGRAQENDYLFRRKRKHTLFLQGVALPGAIQSAVYDVEGVKSLVFRENYTSEPKEIDGKILHPHSIYLCIDGGKNDNVARAIFDNKSGGCGYTGADVTIEVEEGISGKKYPVVFDRPELVDVRAQVTVKQYGSAVIDKEEAVREAILAYADGDLYGVLHNEENDNEDIPDLEGFTTGTSVSPFELGAAVSLLYPSLFVVDVKVGLLADGIEGLKPETLPLAIWQKAAITAGSIEVVGA